MKNVNLLAIGFQFICAIACIALGIYYCFYGTMSEIIIFFAVGAVCLINAIRMYIQYRKDKGDGD